MAFTESYRDFVLERLAPAVPGLRSRRMFGGVGIYADDVFFAVIDDDVLYFRVDDDSVAAYRSAGMNAFAPMGPGTKPMRYWSLPADVLEDDDRLAEWAATAIAAARAAKRRD